jgi:putative ABC transport system ATP-binding protein
MDANPSTAAAIELRGLVKVYGQGPTAVRALQGVDLTVAPGEFLAIMGPSGSGKSTLLHLVGALEQASSGEISVTGMRFAGLGDKELTRLRRDHLGFIFQFFNLLPSLTALENVYLPALIAGRRGEESQRRAMELLGRVGLAERAQHLPSELSGGEQQRVSIARSLMLQPKLLLADEPTGNLDSRAGGDVLDLLRAVNREEGKTIVMVTHDPAAAARTDRIIFMRDGRFAGQTPGGSTKAVLEFFADGRIAAQAQAHTGTSRAA